ncbi:MAG: GNAT family N-acetyltransferase [Magnetococcales bacterium]|nr:GNAT family N-acetyltransferase [Magnetococcales bacterium]
MISVRQAHKEDWVNVWAIIEPVFRAGETYAFSPDITEDEAYNIWMVVPAVTYVAVNEFGAVVGTYYIKANQPGLGSHVCNCGYIVSHKARGQGIANNMCAHSQKEAVQLGFRAMQFNFVVSTNKQAIRLWQKESFKIVGTLPGAFNHQKLGYVDAYVMYKHLVE